MDDPGPTLYDLARAYVAAVDLAEMHPANPHGPAGIESAEDALVDHFDERRYGANIGA